MFDVNEGNVRDAYRLLNALTTGPILPERKADVAIIIADLKREIRKYAGRPAREYRVIKEYGIDGYIELCRLPDSLKDATEAAKWFDCNRCLRCCPSQYDCTGQRFTNWYKLVRRHGHWYAYHSVSVDV